MSTQWKQKYVVLLAFGTDREFHNDLSVFINSLYYTIINTLYLCIEQ